MKITARLKKIDRGRKQIVRRLRGMAADNREVHAGLLASKSQKREDSELSNAELGLMHEYGTSRMPARPFVGPTMTENRATYSRLLGEFVKKLVWSGKGSYEQVLKIIGAKMATDIKNRITQGDQVPPPNAPSTLARKQARGQGNPRTLVDTGSMVNSITWEIAPKKGKL